MIRYPFKTKRIVKAAMFNYFVSIKVIKTFYNYYNRITPTLGYLCVSSFDKPFYDYYFAICIYNERNYIKIEKINNETTTI